MLFLRLSNLCRKGYFFVGVSKFSTANACTSNNQLNTNQRINMGIQAYYSTFQERKTEVEKTPLAKSLASLVVECSPLDEVNNTKRPQITRIGMKRLLELRVKKRVKEQYVDGKFHDLFIKVIADPKTLLDAYNSIRVNSNVGIVTLENAGICFESLAIELVNGSFNVGLNSFEVSTRGRAKKEVLVLPNLKLKVLQEAIRMVLEVVYKPHFSKISHGGRSGRGHFSAFKYICKEVNDPDWWFTILVSKKVDSVVFDKLISILEDKIEDHSLFEMIRSMFDANVLNLEFGGFPKGQGLPQEGILSPILMNIYLDVFDEEFHRMSMRYEALNPRSELDDKQPQSKLRNWFRRQIKVNVDHSEVNGNKGLRVYSCRFMDEVFFAVSGSKEDALSFKSEVQNYFHDYLHLNLNDTEIVPCNNGKSVRFGGALILRTIRDSPKVRAVHKLKEKLKLFALQKQEIWDVGTLRIGKKWLTHGLRKVKESEIKHLVDNNSLLTKISCHRKTGMETDHWYKELIKIWMQNVEINREMCEEYILSKYIVEPSLPPTLRDSFYEFQRRVEEYDSLETKSLLSLMQSSGSPREFETQTKVIAPINVIKRRLSRYGIVNDEGYARLVRFLILQDTDQIIDWFSGIVHRWLRWYSDFENFSDMKSIVLDQVRKSCIRTLAQKYRIHESEIEKRFDVELTRVLLGPDLENRNCEGKSGSYHIDNDERLMYGILYSGLCQLSLARIVSRSRPCNCFVTGCSDSAPCVYILHVMERQKFPGWNAGFSSCIHPSLNRRRIGLCKKHLKDLYLGEISLQSIDFGYWK